VPDRFSDPIVPQAPICGSEGGSNQLRDTVPTEDDGGEAACDHCEKKDGCPVAVTLFRGRASRDTPQVWG
jgi:hypothetical protein